jgi:hypothetical protein
MASNRIELRAVCSAQVRTQASNIPESGAVSWPVDASKPFGDEVNLGRFARQLNITAPLELCHYYEGTLGDVIDLSRTPAELAYRARMSVYVRIKKVQRKESALLPEGIGITLSSDEEKLLRRLRVQLQPNLAPQDACPVCGRTELTEEDRNQGDASGAYGMSMSSSSPRALHQSGSFVHAPPSELTIGARSRADVAVQCGNAGRLNESAMPVSFGAASRLRESRLDRPPSYSSGGPVLTGAGFEFDDATSELKRQVEEAVRERDILKRQLDDVRTQKESLERWKAEHRCEVSREVSKMYEENKMLHEALRDVMRGREEVFARLHERRTVGNMITDTPRPYAPFAVSLPAFETSPNMRPEQLLLKSGQQGRFTDGSALNRSGAGGHRDVMNSSSYIVTEARGTVNDTGAVAEDSTPSRSLLKRPSGAAASNVGIVSPGPRVDSPATTKHAPGQCLLRIASVSGEPFHVKRLMSSQLREGGKHVFTLLSLDRIVTDEIFVGELEQCATEGPSGMILSTSRHSWVLYMAPTERSQWIHWFYALNPYLSAQSSDNGAGIPNTY